MCVRSSRFSRMQIRLQSNNEVEDPSMAQIDEGFRKVQVRLFKQFQKNPDLNAVLFLIGMRELGLLRESFSKEEKQDLMHIAVCRLLSEEGLYEQSGHDEDGWPHWEKTGQIPKLTLKQQEYLLKKQIIRYFEAL